MGCVGIGSGDGTRGEAMEEQRRGADVTKIELDPTGLDAAREALEAWAFNNETESVDVGAAAIVRGYLAQALRLRPMSEAPEGELALFYPHPDAPGAPVDPVVARLREYLLVGDYSSPCCMWEMSGWLPLPQPVEPGP